jgi:hypothetical protein
VAVGDTIGGAGFNQGYEQVLSAQLGQAPPYTDPYLVQALGGLPTWYQSVGVTAFRGSNTIVSGGWADRRAARKFFKGRAWSENIGTVRGAIRNNNLLYPRTWTRYASQGMFYNDKYTPMGMAAQAINWAGKLAPESTWVGQMARQGPIVGGGMFSQWMAAERVGKDSFKLKELGGGDSHLGRYLARGQQGLTAAEMANPTMRRQAVLATMKGPIGQYTGGYLSGLRQTGAGMYSDVLAGGKVQSREFQRGARAADRAFEGIGLGGRAGSKVGMKEGAKALGSTLRKGGYGAAAKGAAALGIRAMGTQIPGVGTLMAIWTGYDIAKAIVPRVPEFAANVYNSYTGWGNRRMFGAPFKTNEAAMTSRSRGVMAIQNSRLNARSVIGAEASGMHAYFG